jgi:hypothetical protein
VCDATRANIAADDAEETLMASRIVFERKDGSWGWKLRNDDGVFLATNGDQQYATEKEARAIADRILSGGFKDADKKVRRRTA